MPEIVGRNTFRKFAFCASRADSGEAPLRHIGTGPAAHAITLQRDSRSCSRCSQQTWRLKSERPLRCRPGHLCAKDHDRRDPQADLPAQIVLVPLRGLRAAARDICPDIRNLLTQLPAHQRDVGLIFGLHGLHAFHQHGELPREILCSRRRALMN